MTSPPRKVVVRCPACSTTFETWFRASINLSLGEEWSEEEIEEATSATCPSCSTRFEIADVLVISWG